MDLDSLAKLGEFVGGFFVVVSLAYLAYQVRQNTKSLKTENYARVLERMSTLQARISVDPDINRIFVIGAEEPGRLSRTERVRFAWALYELFGAAEFIYHQSRAKALPPMVWKRWDSTIGWWLSHPGMRVWWATKPVSFTSDFEKFASEAIRTDRFDAAAVERWHGFVAGAGMSTPETRTVAMPEATPTAA